MDFGELGFAEFVFGGAVCAGASPAGVPQVVNSPGPRQICVGPTLWITCRSVVVVGIVQVRVTFLPFREARRSDGGLGRSSDGGRGGPIVAQAANISGANQASQKPNLERLMRRETDYQNCACHPERSALE